METEYRTRLGNNPMDVNTMVLLIEMMAASGQADQIDKELNLWQLRLPVEARAQVVPQLRALGYYEAGKFAECEQVCRQLPMVQSSSDSDARLATAETCQGGGRRPILQPALG